MGQPIEPTYRLDAYWIAKRPNSETYYRFWYDPSTGNTRRASLGTRCFETAKQTLKVWFARNHLPGNEATENVPLSTVLRLYYEEHAMDLPSHEAVRIALTKWLDYFQEQSVAQAIKPQSIDRFIVVMEKRKYAPNYINRILAAGRAAINRAYKQGILQSAPYIKEVKVGYVPPKGRPLDPDEMRAIYHLSDTDYLKQFVLWMAGTVARPAAIYDLIHNRIDLEHDLVILNPIGRAQNKKYRPTVKLPATLKEHMGEGPFLLMKNGRNIRSVKSAWRRMRKATGFGLDVTPYSIRHTMARHLRICGVPAWEVSAQLGHKQSGMSTTEIYAPFDPAYLTNAVVALDNYLKDILISPDEKPVSCPLHVQCQNLENPCDGICVCKKNEKMVVDTRIELVTPAMSMQCSTAELIDHLKSSTAQIGLCRPSVKQIAYV